MTTTKSILILTLLTNLIESKKAVDNLLLFTHPTGPSHLSVAFDLAERFNDSENIHDIRFPMLDIIWNFKKRKNFQLHNFDFGMKRSDELKKYLDELTMKSPGDVYKILEMLKDGIESMILPCKLKDPIFDFLDQKNLALIDVYSSACHTIISRKHQARVAYFAPGVEHSTIAFYSGAPLPSYAMSFFTGNPSLDFSTRLTNLFSHSLFKLVFLQIPLAKWWYNEEEKEYRNLEESVVIVNSHKFIGFPLPRNNLIVEMGNLDERKEIGSFGDKIQTFIDSYKAIVYFSMSTYTSNGQLPTQIANKFLTAFKDFPNVGFIWRLKKESDDLLPNNVLFIDWIDQRAILAHPKTKLLITHCGMNSLLEASHSGIPFIGFPTIGDQYTNSEAIKRLKMGIIFDLYSFNSTQLSIAIHKILKQNSIESNSAKKLKDMLRLERESKINLDGTFALKRFMRMSQVDFKKYWVLNNVDWISHFYIDLMLVVLVGVWVLK